MKNPSKTISLFAVLFFSTIFSFAQNNVGINTTTPAASAALEVKSGAAKQGILIPQMTKAERDGIASPANSLLIYQTDDTPGFYYNSATMATPDWKMVGGSVSIGPSLQLLADKVGGTGENPPLAGTTSPTTVAFNNASVSPTNGNTWTGNNTFTVGAGQGGVYMVQARVHGSDHPTNTNNTISYSLTIQINNTAYGSTGNVYGTYTPLNVYTPAGTKARGEIVTFIKLNAGDTFKVLVIGTNSGVAAQAIIADAGTNIMVMKMN